MKTMINQQNYTGKETYHLMLSGSCAAEVVDEWMERGVTSDMRLRRSKDGGHIVIETRDVIFARDIHRLFPSTKVHIQQ